MTDRGSEVVGKGSGNKRDVDVGPDLAGDFSAHRRTHRGRGRAYAAAGIHCRLCVSYPRAVVDHRAGRTFFEVATAMGYRPVGGRDGRDVARGRNHRIRSDGQQTCHVWVRVAGGGFLLAPWLTGTPQRRHP